MKSEEAGVKGSWMVHDKGQHHPGLEERTGNRFLAEIAAVRENGGVWAARGKFWLLASKKYLSDRALTGPLD